MAQLSAASAPEPSPAWHACVAAALALLGVFLPFSSAGVAMSLGALLLLALVRARALWNLAPWQEPVIAAGLALLAFIAAHTLWTTGWQWASLHTVNRYHELLLAPLLLALLRDARHRLVFIRALMAGAALLALVHWVGVVEPAIYLKLSTRRISAGFALAVCAFVLVMLARGMVRPWPARALAAFFAVTVLFAIEGRTGHVVVVVLAACAAWLHSPRRWRWPAAVACALLVLALAMSSGAVHTRISETLAVSQREGSAGELQSTGIRIELLRLALDVASRHPATGVGFANYSAASHEAAAARYGGNPATEGHLNAAWSRAGNPHNEYLLQLAGGGAVSLALFLGWLGTTLRTASRAAAPVGGLLGGVAIAFAVGCLFNSMLLDFVESHLYMGLLALLLAEHRYGSALSGRKPAVRRILVVATRQIGDVLLTSPLIRSAQQRWPQARIDVLGFQGTLGMLRGNPDVNELIETPARAGWPRHVALARRLWRAYDLALVADSGDRAHLIGWIAAFRRHGVIPERGGSNWWKKALLDHAVVGAGDLGSVHVTAEKLSLLGPDAPPAVPEVVVPAGAALPPALQQMIAPGAVVVHAPSMWTYKQWPISHFEGLIKGLLAQGRQVLLTGSGSERDQACIAPLRGLGAAPQLIDLSAQLDFNQLVTVFERAALYIGPDTSVSHLAAATGVPVIAIFGPTNPLRWAPWPARAQTRELFERSAGVQHAGNVTIVQGTQHCVPCGRAGCEDHRESRSDCLQSITPEQVLEQAMKVLAAAPGSVQRPTSRANVDPGSSPG